VLDIMKEENLPQRANEIGEQVLASFRKLEKTHKHVVKARGLGAMCAIEIIDPKTKQPDKDRTARILQVARSQGLLAMAASGNVIRTLMPLVIGDDDLQRGLNILEQSVAAAA
jgi:4-aminobutyrate aminotransferase/(S)-3-amino-2-methylpropionate transaminase